jgi:hypothetical protein
MPARRPLETLDIPELMHLLELAIEAGLHVDVGTPVLSRAYGTLAAECRFELWSRQQAGARARHVCGRSLDNAPLARDVRSH